MNLSTHKVIESAHVKVDEFAEKTEEERKNELEVYKRFVFIDTLSDTSINKKTTSTKPNIAAKLQEVQNESQGPNSQPEAINPMPIKFE